MIVSELIQNGNFIQLNENNGLTKKVDGVFVGDLLSNVMGNGESENIWVTVQSHINVIAVALLREFSCIIFSKDTNVNDDIIAKANEENIILIKSEYSTFETVKLLINLGL